MSTRTAATPPAPSPARTPRAQRRRKGLVISTLVLVALVGAIALVVSPRPATTPWTVHVVPTGVGDAIPDQAIVLLASWSDDGTVTGEADVSAVPLEHRDQVTVSVVPDRIATGEVAEITVVIDESVVADLPDGDPVLGRPAPRTPDDGRQPIDPQPGPVGPEGVRVPVRVTVTRGGTVEVADISINVSPGDDTLLGAATPLRDRFASWLATEHPDLGITVDTQWTPTIVQPHILVVSHYLFFSEEWEMGLMWHVMIAPHDWSRIYLRPRGEMAPTMAFEIPSVSDPTSTIRDIPVPAQVDR